MESGTPKDWMYSLLIKDNKGEEYNVVLVNGWNKEQGDEAKAALKTLQAICDSTVTAWIEVDEL